MPQAPDPEVEAAWVAEIQARMRAIDEGREKGIPYDGVLREADPRLAETPLRSAGTKYLLFYRRHLIGKVTHRAADFPNLWGSYELAAQIDVPELAHVRDYIAFSVRTDPLREADRFDEIDPSEEALFTDLIESDDWSLVEEVSRCAAPILIPLFCRDGGFIWRWDLRGPEFQA